MSRSVFARLLVGISLVVSCVFAPLSASDVFVAEGEGGQPDLLMTDASLVYDSALAEYELAFTLRNEGGALGARQPVFMQLLTGPNIATATEVDARMVLSLGSEQALSFVWRFAEHTLNDTLYILVDPDNQIAESNERNNIIALQHGDEVSAGDGLAIMLDIDADSWEVITGNLVRFVVSVRELEAQAENPTATLQVHTAGGELGHTSGALPLLFDDLSSAFGTEVYWSTIGMQDGDYTISVTISAAEQALDSVQQVLSLVSIHANHAPVAHPDLAVTVMGTPVDIDLLRNDYEPDGQRLEHLITTLPQYGEVTQARGTANYIPDPDFVGVDHFMYQLDDLHGGSDWAEVSVTVLPPEDGCTWVRDFQVTANSERVAQDGWADFNLPESGRGDYASEVLSNDNPDLFEEQPFISFPSCSLYFTPKAGAVGSATLSYHVVDGETKGDLYQSALRQFTIHIEPDQAPITVVSTPTTQIEVGDNYLYAPLLDSGRTPIVSDIVVPGFLEVAEGRIVGTPGEADIGLYPIVVSILVGERRIEQSYWLTVTPKLAASLPIESPLVAEDAPALESASEQADASGANSGTGSVAWPLLMAGFAGAVWRRRRQR